MNLRGHSSPSQPNLATSAMAASVSRKGLSAFAPSAVSVTPQKNEPLHMIYTQDLILIPKSSLGKFHRKIGLSSSQRPSACVRVTGVTFFLTQSYFSFLPRECGKFSASFLISNFFCCCLLLSRFMEISCLHSILILKN